MQEQHIPREVLWEGPHKNHASSESLIGLESQAIEGFSGFRSDGRLLVNNQVVIFEAVIYLATPRDQNDTDFLAKQE
jgi:hypothetical protein